MSTLLATLDVPPVADGVRAARQCCADTLSSIVTDDDLLGDAEMVTSELVTNAVRAGATRIVLEISTDPGLLRISVLDDAPGEVRAVRPEPLGLSGRGLRIVDTLAERWGVEPWPGAKTVWADLRLPATDEPDAVKEHHG